MTRRSPAPSSSMPAGKIIAAAAAALLVLGAVAGGCVIANKLGKICREQCVVTDPKLDIVVTTGKTVPANLIINHFGLTNGVNIAELELGKLRAELLRYMPNIRDLRIEWRQPNAIRIDVIERIPVARIMTMRTTSPGPRVADVEGFVFTYPRRETEDLPIVRDPTDRKVKPGEKLDGMAEAALRMVEASRESFKELGISDVNTSYPDWLEATLEGGIIARIAWQDMTTPSPISDASMRRQLRRLSKAIASGLSPNTRLWTATDFADKGRIYANDPSRAEN